MATEGKDVLLREAEGLSAPLLQEALDFMRFLKMKAAQERLETALLSQTVLEKDWLRPEEDEAWQDL
ncbi:MAG: DUF2281 domain-containing protein [Chloroflexota bacterium]|nr:MAG: DUF2281 domain-containing protein [Chloroflexota bacterium]